MGKDNNHLKPNYELDRYVILHPISKGGFSVVYLAVDKETNTRVVIKEYMPKGQAKRLRNNEVVPFSQKRESMFNKGRMLFFQEASILATLKHPNIVNVINFFRANGTAYMVMEYEKGDNLQEYIQKYRGNLSEKFILTVFPPLLEGLQMIHNEGYLHLDIKPGNVHIRPGGKPLLLDFGSVHRRELSRLTQPGQVMTTGYSPIEQVRKTGYVGPWTDLYAIGATMRSCIEGHPPIDAKTRHLKDTLVKASIQFRKRYNPALLEAIDWCMEVEPELRPQSVEQLLERIPRLEPRKSRAKQWLKRLTGTSD